MVVLYGKEHDAAFENIIKSPLKLLGFLLVIVIIIIRKCLTRQNNVSKTKLSQPDGIDNECKILLSFFLVDRHEEGQF